MLIFLAGLALLLMLFFLGQRAGAQVWHGGSHRYLDHCASCDANYARPAGVQRLICPQGHAMSAVVTEAHTTKGHSLVLAALCAGFACVAVVLTAIGVVPPP